MQSTIDNAGRVITPAIARAKQGLIPGHAEIAVDEAGMRIEAIAPNNLTMQGGRLVIAGDSPALSTHDVRELRLAGQR
jgi:hypothetical protein